MPVFLDLDNTLVDRDGAFSQWAQQAVSAWGGDADDVAWLVRADAGGYVARAELAQLIMTRLNPPTPDADRLVSDMRNGIIEHLRCYPGVLAQLQGLAVLGQSLVIITNGYAKQQRTKLERTGLSDVITGLVISGEVGFKKPDPRIFEAARAVAHDDGDAWMIGDNVSADIAGARAFGWATAWVSHERVWPEQWVPSLMARNSADALALVRQSIEDDRRNGG